MSGMVKNVGSRPGFCALLENMEASLDDVILAFGRNEGLECWSRISVQGSLTSLMSQDVTRQYNK